MQSVVVVDVEPNEETVTTDTAKSPLSSNSGSFDQASSFDDDNSSVSFLKYQNKPSVVCDSSDNSGAVSLSRHQKIPADGEVVSEDGECVRLRLYSNMPHRLLHRVVPICVVCLVIGLTLLYIAVRRISTVITNFRCIYYTV